MIEIYDALKSESAVPGTFRETQGAPIPRKVSTTQEQPSETLWVEEFDGNWDFGEWRSGVWHALNTSRYKTEDEAITALEIYRDSAKAGS